MQDEGLEMTPILKRLLEAVDRAEDTEARQRAWNARVEYQREHALRAKPGEKEAGGG
jgi:hypothetical protein